MSPEPTDPGDIPPAGKTLSDWAEFDPQWIEAQKGSEASTELSKHRTHLSEHRTNLSQNRTSLSKLRSHLSNERTHLSYLRTAVSLIGFGITINRFSIYLQQQKNLDPTKSHLLLRDTGNVGFGMVVLGTVLLLWSLYRYWLVSKEIEAATYVARHRSMAVLTILLLVLGVASVYWLFTV